MKYKKQANSWYTDTYNKTEKFYEDIKNNVEERFHASNYDIERPLPTVKKIHCYNDKIINR